MTAQMLTRRQQDLLTASKVCWWLSAIMSILFIKVIVADAVSPLWYICYPLAIALGLGAQHLMTMTESILFSGEIPAPWRIDWAAGDRTVWIAVGALVCLLLDIILNFGGVNMFLSKLNTVNGMEQLPDEIMKVLQVALIILFSAFLAVGPELLKELALNGMLVSASATNYGFPAQQQQPIVMQYDFSQPVQDLPMPKAAAPVQQVQISDKKRRALEQFRARSQKRG